MAEYIHLGSHGNGCLQYVGEKMGMHMLWGKREGRRVQSRLLGAQEIQKREKL